MFFNNENEKGQLCDCRVDIIYFFNLKSAIIMVRREFREKKLKMLLSLKIYDYMIDVE